MKWWQILLIWLVMTCAFAVVVGMLFFLPEVISREISPLHTIIDTSRYFGFKWFISGVGSVLVVILLCTGDRTSLKNIKMTTAGNGQFGTSRWATSSERNKMYKWVAAKKASESGVVIAYNKDRFSVDTSDHNLMVLAPPGAGKTKDFYIPSIIYNCRVNRNTRGKGASMIIVDVKGEEYRETAEVARQHGYTVRVLDYRHPLTSDMNNMMYAVNTSIDWMRAARTEAERVLHRARAERHAKILSSTIMNTSESMVSSSSESSQFFSTTAEGLITAMILVVSEYGLASERHLPSVFRLLIELNGLVKDDDEPGNDVMQKSRLKELLSRLPADNRAKLFAGASMNADVRTSMNIFSSAMAQLLNFVDNELEQMICGHSEGFSADEFVEKPTIVYLIVPDEDSTRHLFSSLFIRQMISDLLSYAEEYVENKLPRNVIIFWDEFGNSPAIKDLDAVFTAARSRGIRMIIALQSYAQLEKRYGHIASKIIREACQMRMSSYVSAAAEGTAGELSKSLGSFTTQSGSRSKGEKNNSQSTQLVGRALLMPDEIMRLPIGTFVVTKNGQYPIQTKLLPFSMVWKNLPKADVKRQERPIVPIDVLTEEKIIKRSRPIRFHQGMLYDDSTEQALQIDVAEEELPRRKKGLRKKGTT